VKKIKSFCGNEGRAGKNPHKWRKRIFHHRAASRIFIFRQRSDLLKKKAATQTERKKQADTFADVCQAKHKGRAN
jgi:hypothetical protein